MALAKKQAADAIKKATDANKSYVSNLEKVAGITKNYKDGLADAQKELEDGTITTEQYEAIVRELGDAYTEAKNKIVLSLLEMKLTADGTFDDQDAQTYIRAMEKFGVITKEDADALNDMYKEATKVNDELRKIPTEGTVLRYRAELVLLGEWEYIQWLIENGGGGGGACFVAGTLVTMADNSTRPIERLEVGDRPPASRLRPPTPCATSPRSRPRTCSAPWGPRRSSGASSGGPTRPCPRA